MMVTHNMVADLPKIIPLDRVCRVSMLGNHHHVAFDSRKVGHAENCLELVPNDLCCMKKPSLAGAKYILSFIDDFSRFTWVSFSKNESKVFGRFNEFTTFTEKQLFKLSNV